LFYLEIDNKLAHYIAQTYNLKKGDTIFYEGNKAGFIKNNII